MNRYTFSQKLSVHDAFMDMVSSNEIADHGYNNAEVSYLLVERTGVPMKKHTLRDFMREWDDMTKNPCSRHNGNRFLKKVADIKHIPAKPSAERQEDLFDMELILETVKRIDARQEKLESYLDEERGCLYGELKKISEYLEHLQLDSLLVEMCKSNGEQLSGVNKLEK